MGKHRMSKRNKVLTQPDQLQEALDLYNKGASLKFLATKYGTSIPTVRRRLLEAGAKIRGRGRPKEGVDIPPHHPSQLKSGENAQWKDLEDNNLPTVKLDNSETESIEEVVGQEHRASLPNLTTPSRSW